MPVGGGFIIFAQNLGNSKPAVVRSTDSYTLEIRVRFPGPSSSLLPPSELSGSIWTLSTGSFSTGSASPAYLSLWYEKPYGVTSMTGNVYLTSSAGRLQLTSASIFDDSFYNIAVVKELTTGSVILYANKYVQGAQTYLTSALALTGAVGFPFNSDYTLLELGSSSVMTLGSKGQFWAQEFRSWAAPLNLNELNSHAAHFESYGRDVSYNNKDLRIHWRLADGQTSTAGGNVYAIDSALSSSIGTGSNFAAAAVPYTKFLEDYAYIPSVEYGWNQQKIRIFNSSTIESTDRWQDERFVSLEFNMYDALNEDISHLMSSYDELNNLVGLPMNRYRESYEGLQQMRETYFKRLQGQLSFRTFVDMLDFFDSTFVSVVARLLPARALFKGDELVVESHILERPKYQYGLRPVREGFIDISGSVRVSDLWGDVGR